MLPPETLRVLLLIGLAATGYMLIQAWNEDYIQNVAAPTYSEAPDLSGSQSTVPSVVPGDVPAQPFASPNGASDVPDASLLESSVEFVETPPAADEPTASRLVTVFTPSLKVWIDRLGGDVVRVQLPSFPVDIDQPDVPYLLLENGGGHVYVAQTGLMGADGVDSGDGRPLYESSTPHLEVAADENSDTGPYRPTSRSDGRKAPYLSSG